MSFSPTLFEVFKEFLIPQSQEKLFTTAPREGQGWSRKALTPVLSQDRDHGPSPEMCPETCPNLQTRSHHGGTQSPLKIQKNWKCSNSPFNRWHLRSTCYGLQVPCGPRSHLNLTTLQQPLSSSPPPRWRAEPQGGCTTTKCRAGSQACCALGPGAWPLTPTWALIHITLSQSQQDRTSWQALKTGAVKPQRRSTDFLFWSESWCSPFSWRLEALIFGNNEQTCY